MESGKDGSIDEAILSTPCLISRICCRHWTHCSGGDRCRRRGKRSVCIFEEIKAIKKSFNLELPIKIIGGKKLGDTAKSDARNGFGWLIGVGDVVGAVGSHGRR
ncbi:hypothetical protein A2U01_0052424, partial [Trifolium medium]|nr:hypothetical protein [Trifolium medium]